ncbi:transient receptor potential [Sesbania bispinosa]|nr:transient receptor potential [Sesbania bispinosa]
MRKGGAAALAGGVTTVRGGAHKSRENRGRRGEVRAAAAAQGKRQVVARGRLNSGGGVGGRPRAVAVTQRNRPRATAAGEVDHVIWVAYGGATGEGKQKELNDTESRHPSLPYNLCVSPALITSPLPPLFHFALLKLLLRIPDPSPPHGSNSLIYRQI